MQKQDLEPAWQRRALAFIFVMVVLDVMALGIVIPVLPKLIETMCGGNTATEQGQLQGANSSLVAVAGLFGPGLFTFVFARVIADGSGWNLPGAPFLLAAALLFAATLLAWQLTRGKGAAPAT